MIFGGWEKYRPELRRVQIVHEDERKFIIHETNILQFLIWQTTKDDKRASDCLRRSSIRTRVVLWRAWRLPEVSVVLPAGDRAILFWLLLEKWFKKKQFSISWSSQSGDDPDLAKYVYKVNTKVKFQNILLHYWLATWTMYR